MPSLSRRSFLKTAACGSVVAASAGLIAGPVSGQSESPNNNKADEKRYRISICDWDLAATGNPKSFVTGRELGFEGVEVSYRPDGEFSLSKPENRKLFLETAKQNGLIISSFAMGILNERPLATDPDAESWVADCIDAMVEMNVPKTLLAFFGNGDIKDDKTARAKAVEKLKRLAAKAEEKGKVLGIESYLNAEEHLEMLQAVGSESLKVYHDAQNMLTKEYAIYDDMETLFKEKAVCQVHAKEYDARLGEGKIDFKRFADILNRYDYRGWVVVESSVQGDWKESQAANAAYLKKLLQ